MGAIDRLQNNIKLQFISFFESLTLISECENKPLETALCFIERKLLNHNQIYLFLFKEMALYEVRLFDDDYCIDDTYNGKYISKTTIIKELKKSIEQGGATEVIANYGFGLQKFVHQAHAIGVEIPNNLLAQAQSPDCYHDESNPLTEVVKELQAQITQMRDNVGLNNNHPNTAELQAKDGKIAKLQAENDKLKRQLNERSTPTNNSHTNTALIALNDAIATHWQDPNNPPKQQFIQAWIMDNYPSIEPSKALWIDKIIRHKGK
ncbi:hypothetical protein [Moraxella catarrhalis]|uniref:hypothetical protein n=1 Tax=Moraxella catarrhalis TaxID=480 RepID=UPI0007F43BC1|nr:hypothetical protein [Moraxella catarrhalis]OAV05133.1 hypothetical protein AO381_0491 [Moraxella catarrhalis]